MRYVNRFSLFFAADAPKRAENEPDEPRENQQNDNSGQSEITKRHFFSFHTMERRGGSRHCRVPPFLNLAAFYM